MQATKITTHVADALERLMEQYRGQPRMTAVITAFAQQIQDLEDGVFDLNEGRQLWDGTTTPAVGEQLDELGKIVGVSRNGLEDAEYILFIFGKIASDYSDTTIPSILNVVAYLFQAELVLLQNYFPASVAIQVLGTPIDPAFYGVAVHLVELALGAGIKLSFLAASTTVNTFRFDGPGVVGADNGFGDDLDPSIGGVFADVIP